MHAFLPGVKLQGGFLTPLDKGWFEYMQHNCKHVSKKIRVLVHPDKHPQQRAVYEHISKNIGMSLDIISNTDKSADALEAKRTYVQKEKKAWRLYKGL